MTNDGQDASLTTRLPVELLRHAQFVAASRDETLSGRRRGLAVRLG